MIAWLQSHWQSAALILAVAVAMRLNYWVGLRKGREGESIDALKRKFRAVEALKPFADLASAYMKHSPRDDSSWATESDDVRLPVGNLGVESGWSITIGQLREAYRACYGEPKYDR